MRSSIDYRTHPIQLVAAAVFIILATIGAALAQRVVVFVNGEPITEIDVEQRIKFIALSTHKRPSRQEIVDELIDEKLKVHEAKRWGVTASDSEVNSSFATMAGRLHLTAAQLTQDLARRGIYANTLKSKIRADLVWQRLVRGRYQSRLELSETDVMAALRASGGVPADTISYDYTLRPILLVVPPGSSGSVYEARRHEAEAMRSRFRGCRESLPSLRAARDVAVRDAVIRNSGDMPEPLQKVLDSIPVGQMTAPEITRLGVEMFAVCSKVVSKADSPSKRQARQAIFSKRFDRESKRYLAQLRRAAMIERH